MANAIYCLDASAIIHAWVEAYPPSHFGALWEYVDEAIQAGRIISAEDVRQELNHPEELKQWANRHRSMFHELEPDLVASLKTVLQWARDRHSAQGIEFLPSDLKADPIVVALARIRKAMVVCEEFPGRGPMGRDRRSRTIANISRFRASILSISFARRTGGSTGGECELNAVESLQVLT